jgi:hypothetical protein
MVAARLHPAFVILRRNPGLPNRAGAFPETPGAAPMPERLTRSFRNERTLGRIGSNKRQDALNGREFFFK